jgi:hypothetical protein
MRNEVPPGQVRTWEQLTIAVLTVGAITVAGSAVTLLLPAEATTLRLAIGLPTDAALVGFLVIGAVWRAKTRRLRRELGDEEGGRRFAAAWAASIAVFVVAECVMGKALGGPDAVHRVPTVAAGVRVVWVALALLVIAAMHRDMRGVLAGKRRPTVTVTVPGEPVTYDPVSTATLAPADEHFWRAAATAAHQAGVDLPLLETTRALERRWIMVSAAGPSERPAPDAVVTLFSLPPLSLPSAPEYYGLIQPEAGGPIRFQLVLPSRVSDFVATTSGAHRAALYAADDPTARTAATPADQPA